MPQTLPYRNRTKRLFTLDDEGRIADEPHSDLLVRDWQVGQLGATPSWLFMKGDQSRSDGEKTLAAVPYTAADGSTRLISRFTIDAPDELRDYSQVDLIVRDYRLTTEYQQSVFIGLDDGTNSGDERGLVDSGLFLFQFATNSTDTAIKTAPFSADPNGVNTTDYLLKGGVLVSYGKQKRTLRLTYRPQRQVMAIMEHDQVYYQLDLEEADCPTPGLGTFRGRVMIDDESGAGEAQILSGLQLRLYRK